MKSGQLGAAICQTVIFAHTRIITLCLHTISNGNLKNHGHIINMPKFPKGMNEQLLKVNPLFKNTRNSPAVCNTPPPPTHILRPIPITPSTPFSDLPSARELLSLCRRRGRFFRSEWQIWQIFVQFTGTKSKHQLETNLRGNCKVRG